MPLFFENEPPAILPKQLPAYTFDDGEWRPDEKEMQRSDITPISSMHLITWNVNSRDFIPKQRIRKIIEHLSEVVFKDSSRCALKDESQAFVPCCCILFQEVSVEAYAYIRHSDWIRNHFRIIPGQTPQDPWDNTFGLLILYSKGLAVSQAFIFNLPSSSQKRQALFIDIHLSFCSDTSISTANSNVRLYTLRIANTHLESGYSYTDLRARQKQLQYIASMLNVENLSAYLCCGSMSNVLDEDNEIPAKVGFTDAYAGMRFTSYTWGLRIDHLRRGFKAKRLDKILYYITDKLLIIDTPDRIGFHLPLDKKATTFASDHCGLVTKIGFRGGPNKD